MEAQAFKGTGINKAKEVLNVCDKFSVTAADRCHLRYHRPIAGRLLCWRLPDFGGCRFYRRVVGLVAGGSPGVAGSAARQRGRRVLSRFMVDHRFGAARGRTGLANPQAAVAFLFLVQKNLPARLAGSFLAQFVRSICILASCSVYFRASHSGMMPMAPKIISTRIQNGGTCRMPTKIKIHGKVSTQASMPNSTTQMFFTGSRKGPMKTTAITRWAKASQSVPYRIKGYVRAVAITPSWTSASQSAIAGQADAIHVPGPIQATARPVSHSSGRAESPLRDRPSMKKTSRARMRFSSDGCDMAYSPGTYGLVAFSSPTLVSGP